MPEGRCYPEREKSGAARGIRTPDPLITNEDAGVARTGNVEETIP